MNPSDAIIAGRAILDPLLTGAGFTFVPQAEGEGSGGPYCSAAYVRGERRLSFSYRYALGCAEYAIGPHCLDHISYMRLLGKYEACRYASFPRDDPMAGFVALRHDLERFAEDFIAGAGDEFIRLAQELKKAPDGRLGPYLP